MNEGLYKSFLNWLKFVQFSPSVAEPSPAQIDKLWVDSSHDVHYNKNGIDVNLSGSLTPIFSRLLTTIFPANAGDTLDMGVGSYIGTDATVNGILSANEVGTSLSSVINNLDLVSNGDFALGNTNWTEGVSWLIGAGKASVIAASSSSLSQLIALSAGVVYLVSFDIVDPAIGGFISVQLDGAIPVNSGNIPMDTPGTYDVYLLSTVDSLLGVSFICDANCNGGSIDNVVLKNAYGTLSLGTANKDWFAAYLNNLYLRSANGYTTLKAHPDSIGYNLTMPINDGLPGQVLTTDGTGNLSFSSSSINGAIIDTTVLQNSDFSLLNIIPAKNKCTDIIIQETSGTSPVTLNIGTTLAGSEIYSGLIIPSSGTIMIDVNTLFSKTVTQSIYVSSLAWGTAVITIDVSYIKVAN